jgi:CBS-domain-containing membrane protein
MAEHARFGAAGPSTAAGGTRREAVGRRAEDAADLGRLFVDLLDAQIRHGLEVAAALARVSAWQGIVRAQAELFQAGLAGWSRSNGETAAARPDRGRSAPVPAPARGRPVRAVVRRRCSVVAQPSETVQAAVARMTEAACGSVLVCDGDRLLRGLFTERDLATRVVGRGLDPNRTRLAEVMTRDPERIEGSATVREALRRMDWLAHHHPLPVVEGGRALGVLSPHDLPLEASAEMLPELERRRALAERMR